MSATCAKELAAPQNASGSGRLGNLKWAVSLVTLLVGTAPMRHRRDFEPSIHPALAWLL